MKRPLLYIANWKASLSFNQQCSVLKEYVSGIPSDSALNVVVCPSFEALTAAHALLANSSVMLGAQSCSPHSLGAYTGTVTAQSLHEIGCTYCIVGHSERRTLFGETNTVISKQIERLLQHQITPIVCIGETAEQRDLHRTFSMLKEQLDMCKSQGDRIIVAYEPVWAIGSGKAATLDHVHTIFNWIEQHYTVQRLLYGGSVHPENAHLFKKISNIGGFLIGSASLSFKQFKNIVSL